MTDKLPLSREELQKMEHFMRNLEPHEERVLDIGHSLELITQARTALDLQEALEEANQGNSKWIEDNVKLWRKIKELEQALLVAEKAFTSIIKEVEGIHGAEEVSRKTLASISALNLGEKEN